MGILQTLRDRLESLTAARRLRGLKDQASSASASYRPQYNLRAAQLAAATNRREEALTLYGRAIDGYLEAGRGRAAEALCRRIIEDYPDVVRARRTLALLAMGRGDDDEAVALLHEYAATARRTGDAHLLKQSLRMIGLLADAPRIRQQALEELRDIGDDAGAAMIRRGRDLPSDEIFDEASGNWSQAMQAALLDPDRLRDLSV